MHIRLLHVLNTKLKININMVRNTKLGTEDTLRRCQQENIAEYWYAIVYRLCVMRTHTVVVEEEFILQTCIQN